MNVPDHDCEANGATIAVTRRLLLGGLGAAIAVGRSAMAFGAVPTDARLVVLNIRGGWDGLATVIPYGDPALAGLRPGLMPPGMLTLDNFYALHPSLPNLYAMFQAQQAMAIHAVGPTVATRSHFQGQSFLQSGTGQALTSGWLNRAIAASGASSAGVALCAQVPLLLRGPLATAGLAPEPYAQAGKTLVAALPGLTAPDAAIGPAMAMGLSDRAVFDQILHSTGNFTATSLQAMAAIAGTLLAASNGPRVAALEVTSFDTHDLQNTRLTAALSDVDAALAALKATLGAAWSRTVVMTMTEFGRTAYQNGTGGTDHGTAFPVLLAGGAVAGGRVVATWPGLAADKLYQGRDLAPTVDFRAIAMGVLSGHMGIPSAAQSVIFPGSAGIQPVPGLVS